ncbi:MAG TPA: hypothetical protein VFK40_02565, partial [Nitrososphaeraceae archaeon]|nr:hypothetical protein [Nitrososphaeraceae archaeon]
KLKEDRQFIDIILENPKLDIEIKGIDINTNSNTTKPILWWISQNQHGSLLYALTHSPNLVKIIEQNKEGDANESSFFTEWITAPELVGIFRQQAVIKTINPQTGMDDYISTGDENWIEVVRRWINLGCSLPTNIPKPILHITSITEKNTSRIKDKIRVPKVLLYHMIEEDKERPGKIWGMGSVH